jgi:Uma2 family endonuclease
MATRATPHVWTDEELLALPKDGSKYEVVDGELVKMSPAGSPHERIILNLAGLLVPYVKAHDLGDVFGSNQMYVLPLGGTKSRKRSPDLSFVAKGRMTPAGVLVRDATFPEVAPDLAVEVISPTERPSVYLGKVADYQKAGVKLLWVIDPQHREATIYCPLSDAGDPILIGADGVLDGLEVIPGFRCVLGELFE